MAETVVFAWGSGDRPAPEVISDPLLTSIDAARLRAIAELRRPCRKRASIRMVGILEVGQLVRVECSSRTVTGIVSDVTIRPSPSGKLVSEATLDVIA